MALDFRADQTKTHQIISSGSTGTNAQLLIYNYSVSSDLSGGLNTALFGTSSIGTDVSVFVSGAINSRNVSNSHGTVTFAGDVFVSGALAIAGGLVVGDNIFTVSGTKAKTTSSVSFDTSFRFPNQIGSDVYFFVSGAFDQKAVFGGPIIASGSISGSLTRLVDGTPYLIAGQNITIVTQSNGSIIFSASLTSGSGYVTTDGLTPMVANWNYGDVSLRNVTGIGVKVTGSDNIYQTSGSVPGIVTIDSLDLNIDVGDYDSKEDLLCWFSMEAATGASLSTPNSSSVGSSPAALSRTSDSAAAGFFHNAGAYLSIDPANQGSFGTFDGVVDGAYLVGSTDPGDLTFYSGTNDLPFTVAAWVNLRALPGPFGDPVVFLGEWEDTRPHNITFQMFLSGSGKVCLLIMDPVDQSYLVKKASTPGVSMNIFEWHHIAATYDGSKSVNGINLYLDGQLIGTTIEGNYNLSGTIVSSYGQMSETGGPPGTRANESLIVMAGKQVEPMAPGEGRQYTNGFVDDVAIWSKVLTAAEIAFIADGFSGDWPTSSTKSYLTFDGNKQHSGTMIIGGQNDGIRIKSGQTDKQIAHFADNQVFQLFGGVEASLPVASYLKTGSIYFANDTGKLYFQKDTSTWVVLTSGGGSGSIFTTSGTHAKTVYSVSFDTSGRYPSQIGSDVYFFVSGTNSKKAVFGGPLVASGGLSGSLTKLADGTSYLVAGPNITIVTQSNGSIIISGTVPAGSGSSIFSTSGIYAKTTASVAFDTSDRFTNQIGSDVYFFVSGASNQKAVFGGPLVASGGLSGSHTKLADGTSYLIAGPNITIATQSNGAVVISGSAGGSNTVWVDGGNKTYTTSSQVTVNAAGYPASGDNMLINGSDTAGAGSTLVLQNNAGSFGHPAIMFSNDFDVIGNLIGWGKSAGFGLVHGMNFNIPIGKSFGIRYAGATKALELDPNGNLGIVFNSVISGNLKVNTGISGSLTKLANGTSYMIAGSGVSITSASNGAVTIAADLSSIPTGADVSASYVVIGATSSLSNERVLTAGSGVLITDGGAGNSIIVSNTDGFSVYKVTGSTTNATGLQLTTIALGINTVNDINVTFLAKNSTHGNRARYTRNLVAFRSASNDAAIQDNVVFIPILDVETSSSWGVGFATSGSNLILSVTGSAAENINWQAVAKVMTL